MRFQLVTMTPDWASELLDQHNQHNRPLAVGSYQKFASDMREGRWVLTHQAVAIDTEGQLQDGQHRLRAVVEAGVPVQMWVAFDCPVEARAHVDLGVSRTVAHILAMEDPGSTNNVMRGTAARVILMYDHCPDQVWATPSVAATTSKSKIIEFVQKESVALTLAAQTGREIAARIPVLSPSYAAAFLYLVWRDSERVERLDDFVTGILTGTNLQSGDARLVLREQGRGANHQRSVWGYQKGLAQTIIGWNRWVLGNEVRLLRFSRDQLPMPRIR